MAEVKVSLLLSPAEINQTPNIIGSLHVTKTKAGYKLNDYILSQAEIRRSFMGLDKTAREALMPFCEENLQEAEQTFIQKANNNKYGINREGFVKSAIAKHLHQSFENLKPYTRLVKWYHKLPGKKRNVISPCAFSTYKPQLHFEVIKRNKALHLQILINLNGTDYLLKQFDRYGFLLHHNNEYFVLSSKEHQSLEWLCNNDPAAYAHDELGFSQHILQKLEVDHKVNRNNHFKKNEVRVFPERRVLLSELNNCFLMLTPQWIYDGFVVDGPYRSTHETVSDGTEVAIYRDQQTEEAFVEMLRSFHQNFSNQRNGFFYLPFAEAQKKQWFLKVFHKLLEQDIELTGMDLLQHFRYSPYKAETIIQIKSEVNHLVNISISVQFGNEKVNLSSLQKILLSGQKAILLKDNSLGILSDKWMQQYGTIVKHGKIEKDQVTVSKHLAISQQQHDVEGNVMSTLVKQQWWIKWKNWQTDPAPVYDLPISVNATLRSYQQKGYEWLLLLAEAGAGACLADDMGLGKTLQSICFLAKQIEQFPASTSIIICPSSLVYNWQQELQKFAPSITPVVYHGAGRQNIEVENNHQVIITSYGTLRADAGVLLAKNYLVAIIDESHNIKNPAAQITNVVNLVQAGFRLALSGTPVVNNTFDLYAQLNFALPGMFGSREFFKREYADAIDRNHDEEKIKALQKLTAPFILRRTKEQVAPDLPQKNEMILWCNMSSQQQDLYNHTRDQIRGSIFLDIKNNGLGKSKLGVIQGMLKLRQICNSPLLLPLAEQESCTQSVKTEIMVQELTNIKGSHKAIVFSQFTKMLDLLAIELDKNKISYYHFDGQTPARQRAEMVKAFQDPADNTNVFLISLKAGNTGLTLTAADYVFLFDPWWNTAVEQQAIDRTHRIGQVKNVFAYKIICKNTIEEKIIQLQQRKKKLAEELVSEDDSFIRGLNEEDIAYLFS